MGGELQGGGHIPGGRPEQRQVHAPPAMPGGPASLPPRPQQLVPPVRRQRRPRPPHPWLLRGALHRQPLHPRTGAR